MKKIFIMLSILITLSVVNVNAQVEIFDRDLYDNYGVNKKWKITDNNINNVLNSKYVDASEKIYDFSDILTADEELKLYNEISDFIKKTNMDMVILIDDLKYYDDSENEDYAADFYDYNDFGINFDNYSGILLFRNTYDRDPYFNIYTFGNAQLYFDYDRLENTLDYIYYDLKNRNYLEGFNSFISKINIYYDKGISSDMKNYYINEDGYLIKKYRPPILLATIISSIITIITMAIMIAKNKMKMHSYNTKEYLDVNNVNYIKNEDILVGSYTRHYLNSSSSSSGGGGHSSSSGSSGGGHSSGGGRHG